MTKQGSALGAGREPAGAASPGPAKHPDLIYDVGMHKGEDADIYLKKGFRVLGIEADPVLARECRERFTTAIAAGLLMLVEGAIVDPETIKGRGKTVPFYANLDQSAWGTVMPATQREPGHTSLPMVRHPRAAPLGCRLSRRSS